MTKRIVSVSVFTPLKMANGNSGVCEKQILSHSTRIRYWLNGRVVSERLTRHWSIERTTPEARFQCAMENAKFNCL